MSDEPRFVLLLCSSSEAQAGDALVEVAQQELSRRGFCTIEAVSIDAQRASLLIAPSNKLVSKLSILHPDEAGDVNILATNCLSILSRLPLKSRAVMLADPRQEHELLRRQQSTRSFLRSVRQFLGPAFASYFELSVLLRLRSVVLAAIASLALCAALLPVSMEWKAATFLLYICCLVLAALAFTSQYERSNLRRGGLEVPEQQSDELSRLRGGPLSCSEFLASAAWRAARFVFGVAIAAAAPCMFVMLQSPEYQLALALVGDDLGVTLRLLPAVYVICSAAVRLYLSIYAAISSHPKSNLKYLCLQARAALRLIFSARSAKAELYLLLLLSKFAALIFLLYSQQGGDAELLLLGSCEEVMALAIEHFYARMRSEASDAAAAGALVVDPSDLFHDLFERFVGLFVFGAASPLYAIVCAAAMLVAERGKVLACASAARAFPPCKAASWLPLFDAASIAAIFTGLAAISRMVMNDQQQLEQSTGGLRVTHVTIQSIPGLVKANFYCLACALLLVKHVLKYRPTDIEPKHHTVRRASPKAPDRAGVDDIVALPPVTSHVDVPRLQLLALLFSLLPLLLWLKGLHPLWAVPLLVVFGSYYMSSVRKARRALAMDIASCPALLRSLARELPLYLQDGDFQKTEWLNTLVEHCWPLLSQITERAAKTSLQPLLDKYCSPGRASFALEAAHLGSKSPRVCGVRVIPGMGAADGWFCLEVELKWSGDQLFQLQVVAIDGLLPPLSVSLADLLVSAVLLLQLPPDCSELFLSLVKQPSIDFALKLANLDLTNIGISSGGRGVVPDVELTVMKAVEFVIGRILAATLLHPRRVRIPLGAGAGRGEEEKDGR